MPAPNATIADNCCPPDHGLEKTSIILTPGMLAARQRFQLNVTRSNETH